MFRLVVPLSLAATAAQANVRNEWKAHLGPSTRTLIHAEIERIKLRKGNQPVPVQHLHHLAFKSQKAFLAKLLKYAVSVNRCQTQNVGDLGLVEGQVIFAMRCQASGSKTHLKLTKEVSKSGFSAAPAQRKHPFPVNASVDNRRKPEHSSKVRMLLYDLFELVVLEECEPAVRHGLDIVVQLFEHEAVQVNEITRDREL